MSEASQTSLGRVVDAHAFRAAMRQLAGGISTITVGHGEERTGLTVTSVSSLSADPPTVVFCINQSSSSWPVLLKRRAFAVNVLPPAQRSVADRFSGRGGLKGSERYEGARWSSLVTGTPVLDDALAVLDCEATDIVERFGSAVVIGRVVALSVRSEESETEALAYWRGTYGIVRL